MGFRCIIAIAILSSGDGFVCHIFFQCSFFIVQYYLHVDIFVHLLWILFG